ncbi:MAG: L,D-transpeptidase family protein [Planctomycetes bacterium]|nr:L,D-transpeptidase family protein [Planctomycetota bacterium]
MRQFLLGLVVAALVWWGYSTFLAGDERSGGEPPANVPQDLGEKLRTAQGDGPLEKPSADPGVPMQPLNARPSGSVSDVAVAEADLAAVAAGEQQASTQAWLVLAAGVGGGARKQWADALARGCPSLEDPEALLRSLGVNNAFLHSEEGRARAKQLVDGIAGWADDKAVPLTSRLLEACMRGPIEKAQTDARAAVDSIYEGHRKRVDRWLCDPANVARARSHVVAKGEGLQKIANRFRREGILVDDGSLAILNRIHNPNALQVGQKIKIPIDPIHAVVEKRSFLLAVYVGDQVLRLYWVGHGADSKTPVAEFTVSDKLERPDWFAPDGRQIAYGSPENILGDYFIKFANASYTGFGAHGTPMPETIGTMSSAGCIRMYAPDIAELFRLLPRGVKVEVRDSH